MKPLIDAIRFSEDIRYFEYLKGKSFVRRIADRVIDEHGTFSFDKDFRSSSLRVNRAITPSLYDQLLKVKNLLNVSAHVDLHIKRGDEVNAYCIREDQSKYSICLTGALIERMTPTQIDFVLGHELGHALYGHHDLPVNRIVNEIDDANIEDIEDLLRWSRLAEISADRAGLVACNNLDSAVGAMLVLTTGLRPDHLEVASLPYVDYCKEVVEEFASEEELEDLYATHPCNPLRVVAISEFWKTWEKYIESSTIDPKEIEHADRCVMGILDRMEGGLNLSSKIPAPEFSYESPKHGISDPETLALFWAAIFISYADGCFSDGESEAIATWIFGADLAVELNRLKILPDVSTYAFEKFEESLSLASNMSTTTRCSILQKLVVVARADGKVCDQEKSALALMSERLGISPSFSEKILKYL